MRRGIEEVEQNGKINLLHLNIRNRMSTNAVRFVAYSIVILNASALAVRVCVRSVDDSLPGGLRRSVKSQKLERNC